MTPEMVEIFKIPSENLWEFKNRMERLQKKAAKLNCGSVGFEEVGTEEWKEIWAGEFFKYLKSGEELPPHYAFTGRVRILHLIKVFGDAPKVSGWEFVAVIQHMRNDKGEAIGNLLRVVPGCERKVPEMYRTAETWCDHCRTQRYRLDTFVVMNESGETKQIGRNCLRDFLGHTSPEAYARMAEYLLDASDLATMAEGDEFGGSGRRSELVADLHEVLVKTSAVIRIDGWRSRATAQTYGTASTSDTVFSWIFDRQFKPEKYKLVISEADKTSAEECEEWMESLPIETSNEYRYSLALLGRANIVPMRNLGLACSAIAAMMRDKDQEIKRRAKLDLHKNSQFLAEVGKRIELNVTLEWMFRFETDWGKTTLYKFVDENGNLVVWFSSGVFCPGPVNVSGSNNPEIEIGQKVKIKGTVKKHEEREGIKQTVLSRVIESFTKAEKAARRTEFVEKTKAHYLELGYCERCLGGGLTHWGLPECSGCYLCEGTGHAFCGPVKGHSDWFFDTYGKPGAYMALPQSYPLEVKFS